MGNELSDFGYAENDFRAAGLGPAKEAVVNRTTDALNKIAPTVVNITTDALNEMVPFVCRGALSLGTTAVSHGASLASGMAKGIWEVIAGLDNTTRATMAAGLGVGLFVKYYAEPRVRKYCKGVPLPSWIWLIGGGARQVTSLSRAIENLKRRIWKSKELEPVLNENIRTRLEAIVNANHNILKNGGFFKNILLLGDPGTGKTMFMEKIARDSGFNYIKLSGADFANILLVETTSTRQNASTNLAVQAFEEILTFSRNSTYPTVLMIDEIDAMLPNRTGRNPEEFTTRENQFRSKFLAAIGKSKKLLIVGTTNHENAIDNALLSRFGSKIKMDLPDHDSRIKILTQNIDEYLGKIPERATCLLNEESIAKLAERMEGMSGRALFQFVDNLCAVRFASSEERLTEEMIEEELSNSLSELKRVREAEAAMARRREQQRITATSSARSRELPMAEALPQPAQAPIIVKVPSIATQSVATQFPEPPSDMEPVSSAQEAIPAANTDQATLKLSKKIEQPFEKFLADLKGQGDGLSPDAEQPLRDYMIAIYASTKRGANADNVQTTLNVLKQKTAPKALERITTSLRGWAKQISQRRSQKKPSS